MIVFLIIFKYLTAPYKEPVRDMTPISYNLSIIAWVESGKNALAVSSMGAIGEHQIMPATLKRFNRAFKTKFRLKNLHHIILNRIIARWTFIKDWEHFYKTDHPKDRLVKTFNSYNMGAGKTDKGIYYHWYLDQICPLEFKMFLDKHKILWRGKRFLRIEI